MINMIDETIDLDWFAIDENNNVIHFASGGGKLPQIIRESVEEDRSLRMFVRSLPQISGVILSKDLSNYVDLGDQKGREAYLHDFTNMARRGLFSFDKTYPGKQVSHLYHLVCIPDKRLVLKDLPVEIQNKLKRLRLNFNAEQINDIDLSNLID